MNTVTRIAPPKREEFYALLWDKVPEHFRGCICALANCPSSYALLYWDELEKEIRDLLGVAIFVLVESHTRNRRIDAQSKSKPEAA